MSALAKSTPTVYKKVMKDRTIRTINDIAAAFDREVKPFGAGDVVLGKRKLANWTGNSLQAVCNWFGHSGGRREGIPTAYHYQLHLWCEFNSYRLDPAAFGLGRDGRPMKAGKVIRVRMSRAA